jgi:hypothetical protein
MKITPFAFAVCAKIADGGIVFQPDRGIKQAKSMNRAFGEDAPCVRIGRKPEHVNASR